MHSGRVTRRTVLLGASAGGVVALASCGNLSAGPKASVSPTPSPVDVPKPIITCTSPSGLENMRCEDGFDVQVTNGELVTIRVYDAEGKRVSGKIFGGHFQPTWNLHMRSTYIVKVEAKDLAGRTVEQDFPVTMVNPELVCEVGFRFNDTENLGCGMPLWVTFDMPVPEADRAGIEKCCTVTTVPEQEGSFGWYDDKTLWWRPKKYWQAGSTAHIEVNAANQKAGDTWVLANAAADYKYGELHILKANIDTHTLACYRGDEMVKMIPVSMGKSRHETWSGTKIIMTKEAKCIMDSATYGVSHNSPEGYRLTVYWAMRITWSGEYFHAAPWADGSHGYANVSHGCTGMTTANAHWLFDFCQVGDPAEFTGHTPKVQYWNTWGGWMLSWDEWQKKSALHK